MKENKLSVLMSIMLMVVPGLASATSSTFVESFDGTFSETVSMTGTVQNNAPNWSWRILPSSAASLSNISLETSNATLGNNNLTWNLNTRVPFIQGAMVNTSPTGGPNLRPVLTVAGTAIDMTSNRVQSLTVAATGTTSSGSNVQGSVVLDFTQGFTTTSMFGNPLQFIYDNADSGLTSLESTAFSFLNPLIARLKAANTNLQSATQSGDTANRYQALGNNAATNIAGAMATDLSNIKVVFPAASLPQNWTAPIPVTITLI